METSLRYDGEDRHLLVYAKEKFLLEKSVLLQIQGKLDTHTGSIRGVTQFKRKFSPELLTGLDVGARFDTELREITYDVQGKKSFSLSDNGLLTADLKGGYNFNPGSKLGKSRAAVELSYRIFNFTEDQDLKLKIGYNAVQQNPYIQIRENNWTLNVGNNGRLNAGSNGGWSLIFDL